MTKRVGLVIFLGIFVFSLNSVYSADPEKLLTVRDVEKVTGQKGIKLIPRNPRIGAGGDLNFALADNTVILAAMVQKAERYETWKAQEGFFHASVTGMGDEAFEGPGFGKHRYVLIFKKGKTAVSLSSFFDMKAGGNPFLSQEQLRKLAKIIISRL